MGWSNLGEYDAAQLRRLAAAYRAMSRSYSGRQWEMAYCEAQATDCDRAAAARDAATLRRQ